MKAKPFIGLSCLAVFHYLSLRALWPSGKIGCASTMLKKKYVFLGIVFYFHYLCRLN